MQELDGSIPQSLVRIAEQIARQQCDCVIDCQPGDVPKLYALHRPSRTIGRHEVVAFHKPGIDVWYLRPGKRIRLLHTDVSEERAVEIIVGDYRLLKEKFVKGQ
jgi:hypothetical protein